MSETIDERQKIAEEQAALWNGKAGQAWVESQALLDGMFEAFEEVLVAAVPERAGAAVLDVGCGTGATTLAIARQRPEGGACVGADLSAPMIELARSRAALAGSRAQFLAANAQTYAFEPASFDVVVSRFGVMFFDDPEAAFGNLRRATAADGALCCIAWRGPAENPFMTTAERAAAPLLPQLPARRAGGPGQFAFADAEAVREILMVGGWAEIELTPLDVPCAFPASALERYVTRHGPLGLFLQDADEDTRRRVIETVLAAFAPFVDGETVRYTAACWQITGRAR